MAVAIEAADFIAAMGRHVASVCVITTAHEGVRYGLTATAVSSVCAAPPRILACVNKSGMSHAKITASAHFCINVLTEDQEPIAKMFAGMARHMSDRFASGSWGILSSGAPVLQDAVASFDCRIADSLDQFSHSILIGEVVAVAMTQGVDSLLYGNRRFRTLRKLHAPPPDGEMDMLHY